MGHMVCDPCCCFLLLCILIVQLYEVFGARNSMAPMDIVKRHDGRAKTCSTKCMNRVTELGLKGKVQAAADCVSACVRGTTKPEDYQYAK